MILFLALSYFLWIFATPVNLLEAGIIPSFRLSRMGTCPRQETSGTKSIRLLGTRNPDLRKEERTIDISVAKGQFLRCLRIAEEMDPGPSNPIPEHIQDYPTSPISEFYRAVKDLGSGPFSYRFSRLSRVFKKKKHIFREAFDMGLRLLNSNDLSSDQRVWVLGTMPALREGSELRKLKDLNFNVSQGAFSRAEFELYLLQGVDMDPTLRRMQFGPHELTATLQKRQRLAIFAAVKRFETIVKIQENLEAIEVSDLNPEFIQLHDQLLLLGIECEKKKIKSLISKCLRLKMYEFGTEGKRLSEEESLSVREIAFHWAKILDGLQGRERQIFSAWKRVETIFKIQQNLQGIERSDLNPEFIELHDQLLLLGVGCGPKKTESLISKCLRLMMYEFGKKGKPLTEGESLSVWKIASHLGQIDQHSKEYLALQLSKNEKILLDYQIFRFEDTLESDLAHAQFSPEVSALMSQLTNLRSATLKDFDNVLEPFRWGRNLKDLEIVYSKLNEAAKHVDQASSYLKDQIKYYENSKPFKFKPIPRVGENMGYCAICLEHFVVGDIFFQVHREIGHHLHPECFEDLLKHRGENNPQSAENRVRRGILFKFPMCRGDVTERCMFEFV